MAQQIIRSIGEFRRICFSEDVIGRLELEVCEKLGLNRDYQHRLARDKNRDRDKESDKTGILEFARPDYVTPEGFEEIVIDFYKQEGFDVEKPRRGIIARKEKEAYQIITTSTGGSFTLWITEK